MAETAHTSRDANALVRPRVVGLTRVSTADQGRDDRGGVPRQRQIIEQTIATKNLDCLRIYELSDCSGTQVLHNPDVQEILQLVASKVVDGLVVADLDRLFRPSEPTDYAILQVFKDTGAVIYSGDTEYRLQDKDSALFANIRSAISEYELKLIKERAQGAKEIKRRRGELPTNHLTLPLGVSYDRPNRRFYYNEKIATVTEIFRLYDEEGIHNYHELERRTGIHHRTIYNVLRKPIYTGLRVIDQKRGARAVSRTGKHYRKKTARTSDEIIKVRVLEKPAVSQERFDRVQTSIRQTTFNHQDIRKRNGAVNYGTGVLRCGHCSEIFYCSSGKRRSGNRSGQYFCKRNYYAYRDALGGCKQPNLRAHPEVDALIEAFAIRMLNAETLTRIIDQSLQRTREVVHPFPQQTGESQLAALKQKDKRLLDAYEGGALTVDELRTRREAIKTQIASLQRRGPDQKDDHNISIEELARKVVRGAFRFKRMTSRQDKKAIILALFSEIYVKDRSIIAFKLRDDLHATGAAKLGAGFSTPPIHLPMPFALARIDALPEGMRRCSACQTVFPADEFYPRKGQCRRCIATKAHAAYLRRREALEK